MQESQSCAECKHFLMEKYKNIVSYSRHLYVRVTASCAVSLREEAALLGYRNTSLLIRYLIKRRNVKGPLYPANDMKVLKDFKKRELSKETTVISIKLPEDLYMELQSEWRSVKTRSLPSYLSGLLESRYLPREIRFFYVVS